MGKVSELWQKEKEEKEINSTKNKKYWQIHRELEQTEIKLEEAIEIINIFEVPEQILVWKYNIRLIEQLKNIKEELSQITHAIELKAEEEHGKY